MVTNPNLRLLRRYAPYHNVHPTVINKTVVTTLTHTLADLTTRSKLVTLEGSVPVAKTGEVFSTTEADVSLDYPYSFPGVKGFLSLTAMGSFRVMVTDNDTAESVNFLVDRIFVFHGVTNCLYTLTTDDNVPLKVTIIRVC